VARHGTLPHALLKTFLLSAASFLSSHFLTDGLLGLDIESLSCQSRRPSGALSEKR
jgi:hypothetical protein